MGTLASCKILRVPQQRAPQGRDRKERRWGCMWHWGGRVYVGAVREGEEGRESLSMSPPAAVPGPVPR